MTEDFEMMTEFDYNGESEMKFFVLCVDVWCPNRFSLRTSAVNRLDLKDYVQLGDNQEFDISKQPKLHI